MKSAVFALALLPFAALAQSTDTAALDAVTVVGTPAEARATPSSQTVLEGAALEASRVMTTAEALRKIPGVNVRDEEGFGLRPNIGVRGLNPTRSTKVLLLEDGIPLTYGPYGDNASYYHPPVDRFDRIEVLKGSAMNAYGPQTIGAVINYLTPMPAQEVGGSLSLAGGGRGYFNSAGTLSGKGMLLSFLRKDGDGARDNITSDLHDLNFKAVKAFGAHEFTFRANDYSEDSQVTYSGITDAELANFGARYNPFKNDEFNAKRNALSFTHDWTLGADTALITNLYHTRFSRDWWRQSSTTSDGQCGGAFTTNRNNGVAVNPDTCNSAQGRLRDYYAYGVEPRLRMGWSAHELTAGVRYHVEEQDRLQVNGTSPTARTGTLAESNLRDTDAASAFVMNRFVFGSFALTPGLRYERINYERLNRLNGARGKTDLDEVIPSLGATWDVAETTTLYASAHRGFAPPRTEDILLQSGATVTAIDVESEESWNYELGARSQLMKALSVEATLFRNDFERQIAVGSIAGGSTPLATGETLYQGFEVGTSYELGRQLGWLHAPFFELTYTHLPTARSETPLRNVVTQAVIAGSAAGKRLPYAPRELLTATAGYRHPFGVEARLEVQYIGEQFSDFANTLTPVAGGNGQVGQIASAAVWNLAVNVHPTGQVWGVFATAKNLFDKTTITDRTRGIQTGAPRQAYAGVELKF